MYQQERFVEKYGHDFYESRHENTLHSARTILSIVLARIPRVDRAVDLGCGVGTWLSALKAKGASQVQGLDGDWVERQLLEIPQECFKQSNLGERIAQPDKYDLAISLEVAEHLPSSRAESFVEDLTELSDFVLFSAGIPFQGGINHINEQWQDYWVDLFEQMNYVVHDFIRPEIWNDSRIPFWYRQNTLLFSRMERTPDMRHEMADKQQIQMPLNVVHPEFYLRKARSNLSVRSNLGRLSRAIKAKLF